MTHNHQTLMTKSRFKVMAFELRQRLPRLQSPKFLAHIRKQYCFLCGKSGPSDPAHIRFSDFRFDKRETGKGEKPSDQWVVPLCRCCHDAQHANGDERKFWENLGIDIIFKSLEYWREFNCEDISETDVFRADS
jgi:hypothetical protein